MQIIHMATSAIWKIWNTIMQFFKTCFSLKSHTIFNLMLDELVAVLGLEVECNQSIAEKCLIHRLIDLLNANQVLV